VIGGRGQYRRLSFVAFWNGTHIMRTRSISVLLPILLVALPLTAPAGAFDKYPSKITAAFRPAIAEVVKSTVQVLSDGKRSALGMVVDKDGYVVTKASE